MSTFPGNGRTLTFLTVFLDAHGERFVQHEPPPNARVIKGGMVIVALFIHLKPGGNLWSAYLALRDTIRNRARTQSLAKAHDNRRNLMCKVDALSCKL